MPTDGLSERERSRMAKISITPLGTCRINTPLKRGAVRYPIALDLRRIYGFVHTSAEALQQLQYRRGERSFSDDVVPILLRAGHEPGSEPATTDASDLTIVEISSNKLYQIDDVAVQSNYLARHFADFLASPHRAKTFWQLASHADREPLQAFLDSDPVARLCSDEDRSLLGRMRYRLQSFDEVFADMAAIAEIIGKDRLLFVTHVNARTPDGELISSRDRVIRWVKLAAQRLGVAFFDPTALMEEFGQDRAMERGGLDLTHFTNPFYDRWYATVQRDHILPYAGGGEAGGNLAPTMEASILVDSISAAIEYDDFFGGARQLFAALKTHPDFVPLQLLHGRLLARLGDYENARRVLAPHAGSEEMSAEVRQSLMRVFLETGATADALAIASQMLADEYENDEIYEIAGVAAERLGRHDEAVRFRKLAFRRSPANYGAAIFVLDAYRSAGEGELYRNWLREAVETVESNASSASARALAEWALRQDEPAVFGAMVLSLARSDIAQVPALIEEAEAAGMQEALVAISSDLAAMPNLSEKATIALRNLALNWAQTAEKHRDHGELQSAYAFASACLGVLPRNATAIRVRRAMMELLRTQVRAAAGNNQKVVELCSAAGDLAFQHRSIALPFARALVVEKRYADAEEVFRHLHANAPDDIDVRANYAHVAALNGNFLAALSLYGDLSLEEPTAIERYRSRIERFMANALSRGIRHIRALASVEQFADVLEAACLLERYTDSDDRLAAEKTRTIRAMRKHLYEIEAHGQDPVAELRILELMLEIAPDDGPLLRRAALVAMKLERFDQAIALWRRVEVAMPGHASTTNNINRCQILMRRRARTGSVVSALAA